MQAKLNPHSSFNNTAHEVTRLYDAPPNYLAD